MYHENKSATSKAVDTKFLTAIGQNQNYYLFQSASILMNGQYQQCIIKAMLCQVRVYNSQWKKITMIMNLNTGGFTILVLTLAVFTQNTMKITTF